MLSYVHCKSAWTTGCKRIGQDSKISFEKSFWDVQFEEFHNCNLNVLDNFEVPKRISVSGGKTKWCCTPLFIKVPFKKNKAFLFFY